MSKHTHKRPEEPGDDPAGEGPEVIEALSASDAASVMDSLDRNRNKILIGVGGAAVVTCAILVGGQLKQQAHLEAATAYSAALDKREIAAFDGVVVDHPGSVAAGNALLSKAELQIDQGKPADAQTTIERFINEFGGHPRYAQGIFAMGNLYHLSGDAEKAKEYYERTLEVQPDGELSPLARIRIGDLSLEAGKSDEAEQNYQEAFSQHPGTPFFGYAEEKMALLAVGSPPVVKRPEPEPEPEPEVKPEDAPKATPGDAKPADAPKAAKGKGKAKPGNEKGKPKEAPKGKTKAPAQPKEGKAKPKQPAPKASEPKEN